MILNVVQCNSQLLTHDPIRKELLGEVSKTCVRNFQRLYKDADYVGLALRNHKTGNATRWYLVILFAAVMAISLTLGNMQYNADYNRRLYISYPQGYAQDVTHEEPRVSH